MTPTWVSRRVSPGQDTRRWHRTLLLQQFTTIPGSLRPPTTFGKCRLRKTSGVTRSAHASLRPRGADNGWGWEPNKHRMSFRNDGCPLPRTPRTTGCFRQSGNVYTGCLRRQPQPVKERGTGRRFSIANKKARRRTWLEGKERVALSLIWASYHVACR